MKIYHGSDHIISSPEYGLGSIHNDYGRGYCLFWKKAEQGTRCQTGIQNFKEGAGFHK